MTADKIVYEELVQLLSLPTRVGLVRAVSNLPVSAWQKGSPSCYFHKFTTRNLF